MNQKLTLTFLLATFLTLSIVSAIEITIDESYQAGETITVVVSGNFLEPLQPEHVSFRRGHVDVPFLYDVLKINDIYYIYAVLPELANNYSLVIHDISYTEGTAAVEEDVVANFSTHMPLVEFNVQPGVVITKDDFTLNLHNLQSHGIDVTVGASAVSLTPGERKTITLDVDAFSQGLQTLKVSTSGKNYDVPVYVLGNTPTTTNTTSEINETNNETIPIEIVPFRFSPVEFDFALNPSGGKTEILYLHNPGDIPLNDISLSLSPQLDPYIVMSLTTVPELAAGSNQKIELSITAPPTEQIIEGQLRAVTIDETYYLPLTIRVVPEIIVDGPSTGESCSDLGGVICGVGETCDGTLKDIIATNQVCCLGLCEEVSPVSNGGNGGNNGGRGISSEQIIGWAIVLLLIIVIWWFYKKKYKKAKGKPSTLDRLQNKYGGEKP